MEEEKPTAAKVEATEERGQSSSTPAEIANIKVSRPTMSNTLANLRACVKEFDPEQSPDLTKVSRKYEDWLQNFEACADFEDVSPDIQLPAVQPARHLPEDPKEIDKKSNPPIRSLPLPSEDPNERTSSNRHATLPRKETRPSEELRPCTYSKCEIAPQQI